MYSQPQHLPSKCAFCPPPLYPHRLHCACNTNTIQSIKYYTIKYNIIKYYTIKYNIIKYYTIKYNKYCMKKVKQTKWRMHCFFLNIFNNFI